MSSACWCRPSGPGGHRLYAAGDVARLYRLLALVGSGCRSTRSGRCWTSTQDGVEDTVRSHCGRVEDQIEQLGALRGLRHLLALFIRLTQRPPRDPIGDFLDALEAMSMFEKYLHARAAGSSWRSGAS